MKNYIFPSFILLIFYTVLLGGLYPLVTMLMSKNVFMTESQGSFIFIKNRNISIGSELIGQKWTDPKYFWGRSSVSDYDPMASGGTQFSSINPKLILQINENAMRFSNQEEIPQELLLASGSGLDPHITVKGALIQIPRIAKARKFNEEDIKKLVMNLVEKKTFGFLGQERVNVLKLNQSLDN